MARELLEADVRSLTGYEAKSLVNNKGYVLIDIRPEEEFAVRHLRGSVNVPLFKVVDMTEELPLTERLRTGLMLSQGLAATRENPAFTDEVLAVMPEGAGIVVADGAGASCSLNSARAGATGTQSRALMAAYLLVLRRREAASASAFGPIMHLEGGVGAMFEEGFPQVPRPGISDEDDEDDGTRY